MIIAILMLTTDVTSALPGFQPSSATWDDSKPGQDFVLTQTVTE